MPQDVFRKLIHVFLLARSTHDLRAYLNRLALESAKYVIDILLAIKIGFGISINNTSADADFKCWRILPVVC